MNSRLIVSVCALALVAGCSSLDEIETNDQDKNASAIATFYDFQWDGVVEADNCFRPQTAIDQQLLYTVGQLNGVNSVGRLDQVEVISSAWEETMDGCRISYTARMPVAWGYREEAPETYTFLLPRNVSWDAQDAFVEKYTKTCLKWGAQDELGVSDTTRRQVFLHSG